MTENIFEGETKQDIRKAMLKCLRIELKAQMISLDDDDQDENIENINNNINDLENVINFYKNII